MRAKRRINSTGRKRISRENIEIRLLANKGAALRASAKLDLSEHNFPADALLSIEAYRRSTGMRFDCGTIGAPRVPEEFVLDQIDPGGSVLFRVKVAEGDGERGRLLGSAERIHALSEDENKDRRALFPVRPWNLGEQVWKVEIEPGSRPVLLVNRDIPDIKQLLRDNPLVIGSIFPAAFRIVLEVLVSGDNEDDADEDEGTTGWQDDWLKFCNDKLGITERPPADREDRLMWIDTAVERFCREFGFVSTIRKAEGEMQ